MRFDAIDLRRVGIFDDFTLDLSKGAQGVHVIYGRNEAGKSTTLAALRWMLFGFPHSKHDFLYGNDTRAGGVLRNGKQTAAFLRKKGRAKTLESPAKDVLDDAVLAPFLGKVDEDLFERFYGLNHAQLTTGGREIVEAKGEAGQALFAAAGGLQAVRQLAEELQHESEQLFKVRASAPSLNAALRAHAEANKRIHDAELRTDDFRKLERAMEEAAERCGARARELEELTAQQTWLERCQRAYGCLTELNAVREAIEAFGGIPPLHDDFRQNLREAQRDQALAVKDATGAEAKSEELRKRLEALTVETRYLDHAAAIEELATDAASVRAALKDRALLASDARARQEQAARILAGLGLEKAAKNPRAVLPNATVRAAVAALAQEYGALATRLETAEKACQQKAEAHQNAEQALTASPETAGTAAVEAALTQAQRVIGDAERLEELEQRIAEQREQLEAGIQRDVRWHGALEQARTLAVPDEATIEQFKDSFDASDRNREQLEDKRKDIDAEHGRLTQDIAKLARGGSIPTEQELERLRERRDAAWTALRDAWLAGADPKALPDDVRGRVLEEAAADGYSGSEPLEGYQWRVHRADEAADRLRREAERVADHAAANARLGQLEQERAAIAAALASHAAQRGDLEAKWDALWKAPGIAHGTPKVMLAWRKDWADLVQGIEQHAADAAEESRARQRVQAARAEVMEAWRAVHPPASEFDTAALATLAAAAAKWVKEAQQSRLETEQLARECERLRETELPAARTAVQDAAKGMDDWRSRWAKHMKALGLAKDALPSAANAMLEGLDALKEALDALRGIEHRMQDIDDGYARFQGDAARVFKATGFTPGAEPPEEAARTLNAERERHARDAAAKASLAKQLEDEEERVRSARRRQEDAEETLRQLCVEARVDRFEDLPAAEEQAAKVRALLARRARLEEDLGSGAMGETLEAFEARVLEEEVESLEPRIATLAADRERLEAGHNAAQQELGAARSALLAVDGTGKAAEAAQEAAEHHARALMLIEEFARLSLAHGLLHTAVRRHQEKNQGPMLGRASKYFQQLTLGSFAELRAGYDEKGEAVLLGVRPDGRETEVEGMSDGTADQLYLALRLAAIELRAEREDPMPLILDDVLINFDDARAKAALSALATLSSHTQVLLFTHHAHLVELARASLPGDVLFVHELPANGAATG